MREVIFSKPLFYRDLTGKTNFFEGYCWFNFKYLGLALGIALKFYTSVAKELKLKARKFWGLIATFAEVIGGKTGRRSLSAALHLEYG